MNEESHVCDDDDDDDFNYGAYLLNVALVSTS